MKLRALVAVGVFALPSSVAVAAAPEGLAVASGAGVVERPGSGSPWKAPSASRLHAGWDIRCPEGCVLRLATGGVIELDAGAELRDRVAIFARVDDKLAVRAAGLEIRSGALRIDLARSAKPVVLETRSGAALLVPAGGAGGAVERGPSASLAATRGDAHVKAPHARWQGLPAGTGIDTHDAAIDATRTLPEAPAWKLSGLDAGPVGLADPDGSARVGGAWDAVEGATKYRVEISRDAAFTDLVAIRTSDEAKASEELGPGRYFTRVAGVDASGLSGPTSRTRALRVASVIVPPGGIADVGGRTLVVPRTRALAIADPDGLEFGVGRMSFQPVTAVDLSPAKTERLWMRLRGDSTSASVFTLEPRALRADVELSPRNAHWPTDPIDVVVRISDPSHRIDPASIEPKLKAMIEVDDLPLDWSRDGAVFRAHVAPRGIVRNTVVRIEATDEHDNPLGRGFAEIEPTVVKAPARR